MIPRPDQTLIYHITDVENLPGILAGGGLRSDAAMAQHNPAVIGYGHIKQRRMTEIRVACCGDLLFLPTFADALHHQHWQNRSSPRLSANHHSSGWHRRVWHRPKQALGHQ
jgi:ssDNA thymidine ADP-ribosyltransferase, DarT